MKKHMRLGAAMSIACGMLALLALPIDAHAAASVAATVSSLFSGEAVTNGLSMAGALAGLAGTVAATGGGEHHATTKFFRVCTEGDTTDGRVIERGWIQDMADTYDRNLYGARINLEHFRGILPDGPFKAYGDVLALKAEENADGKLQLLAQLSPTAEMIAMNKARQKIFTSCEIEPNFAKTGKAYLTGLAVTDSPASLGTEVLAFARQNPAASPFAGRKQSATCLFSQSVEASFELEPVEPEKPGITGAVKTLLSTVAGLIGTQKQATTDAEKQFGDMRQAVELLAGHVGKQADVYTALETKYSALDAKFTALQTAHDELVEKLSSEPSGKARPASSGGSGAVVTDC